MMEKLSEQTIRHILGDIHQDVKNLTSIATKTNGRLTKLELWRSYVSGAMAVIILLLIPVVIQYLSKFALAYFK